MENTFDVDGMRPVLSAYFEEIRRFAKVYGDLLANENNGEDNALEFLDGLDNHNWVIYTWKARLVLVCTDNATAYEDETGEAAPPSPEVAAYYAMRADVVEYAGRMAR